MSEQKQYGTAEEYLKDLFADEEFTKSVFEMDTPEEVQAALREKGLDISIEGVMKLRDIIEAMIEKGGELSPEELDEVSGGVVALATTAGVAIAGSGGLALAAVGILAVGALIGWGIADAFRRRW